MSYSEMKLLYLITLSRNSPKKRCGKRSLPHLFFGLPWYHLNKWGRLPKFWKRKAPFSQAHETSEVFSPEILRSYLPCEYLQVIRLAG